MFLGSAFFWLATRAAAGKERGVRRALADNQEPICAGVIAGGALMGIAVTLAETALE